MAASHHNVIFNIFEKPRKLLKKTIYKFHAAPSQNTENLKAFLRHANGAIRILATI